MTSRTYDNVDKRSSIKKYLELPSITRQSTPDCMVQVE